MYSARRVIAAPPPQRLQALRNLVLNSANFPSGSLSARRHDRGASPEMTAPPCRLCCPGPPAWYFPSQHGRECNHSLAVLLQQPLPSSCIESCRSLGFSLQLRRCASIGHRPATAHCLSRRCLARAYGPRAAVDDSLSFATAPAARCQPDDEPSLSPVDAHAVARRICRCPRRTPTAAHASIGATRDSLSAQLLHARR